MIKNTLIFSILIATLCTQCIAQKKQSKPLFKDSFGVQAYSFRNYFPKDMIGTLDRIQKMGITKIEGDGGRIPPEEFKKLCADRGITVPSTGAGFKDLEENPEAIAEKAIALGSKFVMCAWVPHDKGNFTKENADHAIKVFESAGKVLAEKGITLCYHAHGYEFQPYGKATLMEYMIENSNPEYLSFEMDILWIHFGGGNPEALLRKYPKRWKLMHVKDLKKGTPKDLTGGTSQENDVVVGTGELDIPGIIKAGNDIGIVHYFIEDESSVVWDQVEKSIDYLKNLKE